MNRIGELTVIILDKFRSTEIYVRRLRIHVQGFHAVRFSRIKIAECRCALFFLQI